MKYTYSVTREVAPLNPRTETDGNITVMHCAHKRYKLGDKDAPTPFVNDDWPAQVLRDDVLVMRPLYMLDHSGLAFSHTPFGDQWDSGLLGWHYVLRSTAKQAWPDLDDDLRRANANLALDMELEDYAAFVVGDVWNYYVRDQNNNTVDEGNNYLGNGSDTLDTILLDVEERHHDGIRNAWERRYES